MSGSAVVATELTRWFGTKVALDSIDLDVPAGTVLGFLGPNGAGKTTAIRVLSTILPPDAGSFSVAGIDPKDPAAIRARIGVLPEGAGYPSGETGLEWVTFHGELFGLSRRDARSRAEVLLDDVGLSDRAGTLISGYSRGMRQRLGIARALVNQPEVVFLDEPTLGLDPAGQHHVLDLIARVSREQQATVVLSTHLMAEVEEVCERVVILNHGTVVAEGTVADVVRRAGAPRQGLVSVPAALATRAVDLLSAAGVRASATHDHLSGTLTVSLGAADPEEAAARALSVLVGAGVPIRSVTIEGGRLSDAFLAFTERR